MNHDSTHDHAGTETVRISIPAEMQEFASHQSFGPAMRVVRLQQAMRAWRVADQSLEDAPDRMEADEHVAVCMLADLRHYCDANGLDFADLDRLAYADYVEQAALARAEEGATHEGSGEHAGCDVPGSP
jgi:hypothetical protein